MHLVVLGLWHLGSVTAACMARYHRVSCLEFDETVLTQLCAGHAPLHEPGLDNLIAAGIASDHLSFSSEISVVASADVVWVCYDTPVDDDDRSDLDWVHVRLGRVLPSLRPGTVVLISAQLPVGTCAHLAKQYPTLHFACSPENLRLGKALESFERPARIIVGVSSSTARSILEKMLTPLSAPIVWMRTESAEMVKHALNSFLALSIAYINEIAAISELVGADAQEVATGLKSDLRIGSRAYLAPGGPFSGGTLARDLVSLTTLGTAKNIPLTIIPAIKQSNDRHHSWTLRKIQSVLVGVKQPVIALLGLGYTPNTSTLRRSAAVELCRQLHEAGMIVQAYDPLIRNADADHRDIPFTLTPADAVRGAHAVVICTGWPEFCDYPWANLLSTMAQPVIIDANRLVEKSVASFAGIVYFTVGRA